MLEHTKKRSENIVIMMYCKDLFERLQKTIHQYFNLIYNIDETFCFTDIREKLVAPETQFRYVPEEKSVGHIRAVCGYNAAGEVLKPFIILPILQNLLMKLKTFTT